MSDGMSGWERMLAEQATELDKLGGFVVDYGAMVPWSHIPAESPDMIAQTPVMDPLVISSHHSFEDQLTASIENCAHIGPLGSIVISVAEEKAVTSYNEMFTCSIHLNRRDARMLRNWLTLALR